MAEVITITAAPRAHAGKGAARATRRQGLVPAQIYGNELAPIMISVEQRHLEHELDQPGFFIRLLDIEVDGQTHRVLPREVQYHPVSDRPLHVDFLRFSATRKLTVAVPVRFVDEDLSPGLKRGGVLNIVRHNVEVLCTADQIPTTFEISLEGFDIGGSAHASMITLPEGVGFTITDRDFTIATVAAPTVVLEEAEEGEGEAAAEGETPPAEGEAPADESETPPAEQ